MAAAARATAAVEANSRIPRLPAVVGLGDFPRHPLVDICLKQWRERTLVGDVGVPAVRLLSIAAHPLKLNSSHR